ncbi:hypothetical protein D043_0024B, partial [Vibrio parahaemolyticus EKP-021]
TPSVRQAHTVFDQEEEEGLRGGTRRAHRKWLGSRR